MNIDPKARVAFQGERGAFSEEAAVELLGEGITLVPRPNFDAMFNAIREGAADYILAPIENTLAGSVHRSFDLLVESHLTIIAEVIIPIAHHLIGLPGASFEGITMVQSHPVALAQCERFFTAHPELRRVAAQDTAGSVREVMKEGERSQAAIAGRRAAQTYGAAILREHLEDDPENYTRFLLLSAQRGSAESANKLSLVFELDHRPGALYHALAPFANRGINLMKIESRPVHGSPWQYRFYLDLQTPAGEAGAKAALDELGKLVVNLRLLGSYPSAKSAEGRKGSGELK